MTTSRFEPDASDQPGATPSDYEDSWRLDGGDLHADDDEDDEPDSGQFWTRGDDESML